MLDTLRRGANSLPAKILFGLLVLAFAVWGIGDIFRGAGRQGAIATVGSQKIMPQTLVTEYQRYLEQLRPMFGGRLDSEQAKKLGFPHSVLQKMLGEALIDQAAGDLGIVVSDDVVRAKIMSEPSFKGPGGKFDDLAFRSALQKAGFTEESFVALLRRDIARQALTTSVRMNGHAPKILVEALYRVQEEKRIADTANVSDQGIADAAEPSDADLAAYHVEHSAAFTAPEYRSVTFAALTLADLAKDIQVSDEDLKQAYEDSKAQFSTPEQRTVEQMVLPDEDAAKRAEAMLTEGKDFAAVAKEVANQDKDAVELGTVTKQQLPKELADAAFALAADGVSPPVKTALGFHVLKVTAIKPGTQKTFEEARDTLRNQIAQDRARDEIDKAANKFEDTLASGASLDEAAAKMGLKTATVAALDAQGHDAKGEPVPGIPGGSFVATAFATAEGKASTLTEVPDEGYFILRVDKVTPSALKPLESVRDVVASAWKGEQRHKAAKARADDIAAKVKAGKSLADAVAEFGIKAETTQPFKRAEKDALPETVNADLFKGTVGAVATGETADGYVVAQLKQITPADPAADKDGVAALQAKLDQAAGTDFLIQYNGALERRYPISVDTKKFDSLF